YAHDGDLVRIDLAGERRAVAVGLGERPVEPLTEVVGRCATGGAFGGGRRDDEVAVGSDRPQESSERAAVACATAVAPGDDRQLLTGRQRSDVRRPVHRMPRRAERGLHDRLVRTDHGNGCAFERQLPHDHLASDAGRLRVDGAGDGEGNRSRGERALHDLLLRTNYLDNSGRTRRREDSSAASGNGETDGTPTAEAPPATLLGLWARPRPDSGRD